MEDDAGDRGQGRVVAAGEGTHLTVGANSMTLKLSGAETDGKFSLIESTVAPSTGPRLHLHRNQGELFYILSGELEFQLGTQSVTLTQGSYVYVSPGTPHKFKNHTCQEVRVLSIFLPPGPEQIWIERSSTFGAVVPERSALTALALKYGMCTLDEGSLNQS